MTSEIDELNIDEIRRLGAKKEHDCRTCKHQWSDERRWPCSKCKLPERPNWQPKEGAL